MELSSTLLKSFAEITDDTENVITSSGTAYGTIVSDGGKKYVRLDGSDTLTAISEAADAWAGDRVIVTIENHTATVTSNLSSPASGRTATETANDLNEVFNYVTANYVTTGYLTANYIDVTNLEADYARIDYLESTYATFVDLQAQYAEITNLIVDKATIETMIVDHGYITEADIEALRATVATINEAYINYAEVETLLANYATIVDLEAQYAEITNLIVDKATIETMILEHGYITEADIETLRATVATINEAYISYAEVETLLAEYVSIIDLEAVYGRIETLDTDLASIRSLLAGTAGVGELEAIHLTADNVIIDEAVIVDAMIADLSADKIQSGSIYTSKVTIKTSEDDASLYISNSTMQFTDKNGIVRVQIGEDESQDYNLYLWDEEQNLLWNAKGLTESGVSGNGGIIKDMAVADDANIKGYKLDIESVASSLNEDGSLIINAANVVINDQTLEAAYTEIIQSLSDTLDQVTILQTDFTVVQGQIEGKIWESDITTATTSIWEEIYTISDSYGNLVIAMDEFTAEFGSFTTETSAHFSFLDEQYTGITAEFGNITSTVSSLQTTVENIQSYAVSNTTTQYYKSTSDTECIGGEWSTSVPTRDEGYFIWMRTIVTFGIGSEETYTISDPICLTVAASDISIADVVPYYSVSEDPTIIQPHDLDIAPAIVGEAIVGESLVGITGEWTTEQPINLSDDEYLWESFLIIYSNGATAWTDATCLTEVVIVGDETVTLKETYSQISQTLNSITLKVVSSGSDGDLGGVASIVMSVGNNDVETDIDLSNVRQAFADDNSQITISAGTITFVSNTLRIESSQFTLDADGNAVFSGNLSAPSGIIGGWYLTSTRIQSSANISIGGSEAGLLLINEEGQPFINAQDGDGNTTFQIARNGNGIIGGWYLTQTRIKSSEGISIHGSEAGLLLINEEDKPFISAQDGDGNSTFEISRDGNGIIGGWYITSTRIKSGHDLKIGGSEAGLLLIDEEDKPLLNAQDGDGNTTFQIARNGNGLIGGFTINKNKIYGTSDTGKTVVMQMPGSSTTWVFAAGGESHSSYSDCPFRVDKSGKLYAESGVVGGWYITATRIKSSDNISIGGSEAGLLLINESDKPLINAQDGNGNTTFQISRDGNGLVGGWTIKSTSLYNGTSSMSSTTNGTYIGTSGIRQYSSGDYLNITSTRITNGTSSGVYATLGTAKLQFYAEDGTINCEIAGDYGGIFDWTDADDGDATEVGGLFCGRDDRLSIGYALFRNLAYYEVLAIRPQASYYTFRCRTNALFDNHIGVENYIYIRYQRRIEWVSNIYDNYISSADVYGYIYAGNQGNLWLHSTNNIYLNGSAYSSSDISHKTNIKQLNNKTEEIVNKVDNLEPVSFQWEDKQDEGTHYGYIANDVKEVAPELVKVGNENDGDEDDETLYLSYNEIIPLLHMKIKQLEDRIVQLEENA